MNTVPKKWDNLISYPDFEVDNISENSLFWRVETTHSFYTLASENIDAGTALKVSNFYHEPIIIKNGMLGNRIFLQQNKTYTIGLTYNSNVKIYIGFIRIIIPDTKGKFITLGGLYLTKDLLNLQNLPEVAVGIVTFNRKKHLTALLNQVKNINYPLDKIKIFVVDNASSDGSSKMIQQDYPEINLLHNVENRGGSGGFNRFFTHLIQMEHPFEYGWLIDDDAVIEKNTLLCLIRTIMQDNSIAVAGSVMMDLENPSTVYEAGGNLFKDKFGWNANILCEDVGNLTHINEKTWDVGYAGAYSLAFKTDILHKVGIWRDYFLHVDDSEWCLRIQKLTGKKVVIALDSLIWHVLQGSKKPFTTLRYYETRNFLDYFESKMISKIMPIQQEEEEIVLKT